MLGKKIKNLLSNCLHEAGKHEINWQPKELPSGIYFYRLQVGNNFVETKKMIILR